MPRISSSPRRSTSTIPLVLYGVSGAAVMMQARNKARRCLNEMPLREFGWWSVAWPSISEIERRTALADAQMRGEGIPYSQCGVPTLPIHARLAQ
jgi:hypothetical protein